jgi:hypothetical protein
MSEFLLVASLHILHLLLLLRELQLESSMFGSELVQVGFLVERRLEFG